MAMQPCCPKCKSVVLGQNGECLQCGCPDCGVKSPDYDGLTCKKCGWDIELEPEHAGGD